MRGVNKVILVGRLGMDPEIRKMDNMRSKLNLRMATTESFKNANGEWTDITDWHTVVMWGPMAERGEKDLHKGNLIYVEGKIRTRSWEDKDGHKRYATEVIADYYQNLSPREHTPRDGGATASGETYENNPTPTNFNRTDDGDDMPF